MLTEQYEASVIYSWQIISVAIAAFTTKEKIILNKQTFFAKFATHSTTCGLQTYLQRAFKILSCEWNLDNFMNNG